MKTRKPYRYWQNIENCRLEAKKFQTISDFARNSSGAYDSAHRNKWLNDVCKHM